MSVTRLLEFFADRRERGEPLVLGAVVETRGSTYSKRGDWMLIDANGVYRGMLSGGCLEGDIAVRAAAVLDSGRPQLVSYDLASDDALWGLGVGCDGMMQILLQPLEPAAGYAPFASMAAILAGDRPGEVAFVLPGDPPTEIALPVSPPPRLLVLGAGADAIPLVRIASELGWRCTVADHRPAYLDGADFSLAEETKCAPAEALGESLDLGRYDMAIVMSHHLVSDRHYLRQLAGLDLVYVGLLGPPGRRQRLLAELGDQAADLDSRLHGPAGLAIGGRGPGPIAVSIVAEMQQCLSRHAAGKS